MLWETLKQGVYGRRISSPEALYFSSVFLTVLSCNLRTITNSTRRKIREEGRKRESRKGWEMKREGERSERNKFFCISSVSWPQHSIVLSLSKSSHLSTSLSLFPSLCLSLSFPQILSSPTPHFLALFLHFLLPIISTELFISTVSYCLMGCTVQC